MADGYQNAGAHDFTDLDEWLCEYVDGTIDPVVCKALEEYMQQNPELASHVERLRETRHLLCQYGCSYQAPHGLQPRLRRRLATEIVDEAAPILGSSGIHLIALATLTSVVAFILIFAIPNDPAALDEKQQMASQEVVQPEINLQFSRNIQATRLRRLSHSAFYSRFTPQAAAYNRAYAPALSLPFNVYPDPHAPQAIPQTAEAFITP